MTGVLAGLDVLDLSWGISGPMATMLLADHGAQVTRIEPPGGDPYATSGSRVWNRGKRSAVLDLRSAEGRDRFLALARVADVVVESWAPGTAARLGVDHETLLAQNPRLVHCSITGYGETGAHADRPAFDALVAARTGQQWESRGVVGGTLGRLSGSPILPGLEPPDACWVGERKDGPLFSGVPWVSVATAYLANLGISAALRARGVTGRGQHVHTSLVQGALATTVGAWQRVERPDEPSFQTWVIDPRAPKGFFQGADGAWTHHWVPLPGFILPAAAGEAAENPRTAGMRVSTNPEDMIILHGLHDQLVEAVATKTADEWTALAASVGVPVQRVRSPEEALLDPLLVEDGCVADVGGVRMVGRTYSLSACPPPALRPAPSLGEHTDEVVAEADAAGPAPEVAPGRSLSAPLAGVVVLDLGLAVAGPFGAQLLADLGAEVIKVNNGVFDSFWMKNHIAMCCNRGKRSITIDLKQPDGLALLHRLVEKADVVHHNMRYDAAERLGVDYESLRKVNPALIYCHTRGHDRGPRELLPGNDQTGAALAGASWMEGGVEAGNAPVWPVTSLGDTGNGFLSAIGVVQALYHRDRTGEGQYVDTSILYAHLLNTSLASVGPDGVAADRPVLDDQQTGWSPWYRLYECADGGWLCLAAVTSGHREAVVASVGDDLEAGFRKRTAAEWFAELDAAGVPVEVSDPDFVLGLFDDPEWRAKGWVTSYEQPIVGRMDVAGLLVDLSDTPGVVQGPPLVPGQDTRAILAELGCSEDEVADLLARGVVESTG